MVETYSVERADETCSRPGHSEHTTGLGLDIALDQYKYEKLKITLNILGFELWFYLTLSKR